MHDGGRQIGDNREIDTPVEYPYRTHAVYEYIYLSLTDTDAVVPAVSSPAGAGTAQCGAVCGDGAVPGVFFFFLAQVSELFFFLGCSGMGG